MKQFESFRLDTGNECLWRDGVQIQLPPKPYAILRFLVDHPGRLITHDELLDAVWPETYVQPQVLRTYMLELRKVLCDDPAAPRFIQTLPKRGYCFVARVVDAPESQAKSAASVFAPPVPRPCDIVDREPEIARLASLLEQARRGQRQFVLITGAAGIGKTALVDAFTVQAGFDENVIVARGQCIEGLGGREEYYPVMEALSNLCTVDAERAGRILARMAPDWSPAPDDAERTGRSAQRMPGDLCAALEELAMDKALVLVFEDVHWADPATCSLLSALAHRRASARLMVLITYRLQEGGAEKALKALRQDLLLRKLCAQIALSPFGRGQVRALIQRHLGQETLPVGLDEFVYQHSEGNPLFVLTMLEHLMAEGYLVREEGGEAPCWRQKIDFAALDTVPDELARMIELEIERLDPADQKLLEAASLIPVAFPSWAVAAALRQDTADTEDLCDDLVRRLYFVRRAGQDELPDGSRSAFYVFAHGLYREVLYQRQSPAQRARRHVRIAERLSEIFAGRVYSVSREVAGHYEAAGEWLLAALTLQAAADHAEERGASAEAESLRDHAMRMADNLSELQRVRLLEGTYPNLKSR